MAASGNILVLTLLASRILAHECERPCIDGAKPMDCYYHFTVGVSFLKCINLKDEECHRRMVLAVNGLTPGPQISVCRRDTITVDVRNILPSGMETSIHWHGLRLRGSSLMDGVPMITQCPIHSGTSFRYRFKADEAGTFYYHAHSVVQQLDGIFGALVVRDPWIEFRERVVVFAPHLESLKSLEPDEALDLTVSGLRSYARDDGPDFEELPVRVRMINAAAMDCPLSIVAGGNGFTLVAVDGRDVEPVELKHLLLNPGERADVLLELDFVNDFDVIGRNLCSGHRTGPMRADASDEPASKVFGMRPAEWYGLLASDAGLQDSSRQIFVPFGPSSYAHLNRAIDFRYKFGMLMPYIPSYISSSRRPISVLQFHNTSFQYPSSPLLSQPDDVDYDVLCDFGSTSKRCGFQESGFCECLSHLRLPYDEIVDLVFVNEGKRGDPEPALHFHGYSFRVVAVESLDEPVNVLEVKRRIHSGRARLKRSGAVEKDTVVVPTNGYAVLRIRTNNPGAWLLESIPSKAESGMGLEMVIQVRDPHGKRNSPPKGYPRCGTMKSPDLVIFEEI